MGFLKPRWQREVEEAFTKINALIEETARLQQEVASLRSRLRSCENSAQAVNARCERLETRLGKLECASRLPDMVERAFPKSDEDAELRVERKKCSPCFGTGLVDADPMGFTEASCSDCAGSGSVETVP